MSKYKAGLHKDVSAIFNGVSLPKSDSAQRSSADPAPGHQGCSAPKPSVPDPPTQKLPVSQPPVQKPSASQPLTQKLPVLQPPVRKPSVSQPPTQKLPASQPPVQKSSISEPPTQKPPVSQPSAQKSSVSQSPVQKPSVSETPAQKLPVSQPSAQKPSASQTPNQKPLVSEPSASKSAVSETPAQKPPAPSHMTSAKPKTQQPPPQSQPKETPAKQPKADTAAKNAGQAQWQRKLEQIKSKLFTPEPGTSPAKQKAMVIAMPVLFIVLIFVFIRVFSVPSLKVTGPGKAGQTKAAVASSGKVEWKVPKPYPTTLRDPMQFGSAGGGTGELIVKGIVYSKDNPTAVIGDRVAHQGDKILGVVVTKINENNVEFEANGKKWMQNVQR